MKVLIVEDTIDIAENLKANLATQNYSADIANDGSEGAFMSRTFDYDAIILDYSLPKKDGITLCKEIRTAGKTTPILFLSVNTDTDTKIKALDAGADDYITKPFSSKELVARLHAIGRRTKEIKSNILEIGEFRLNTKTSIITRKGKELKLTKKEFALMEYFMMNPYAILSRVSIMEHVWTADADPFSNTVEAHIRNLRVKINTGSKKKYISNISGRGYVFEKNGGK